MLECQADYILGMVAKMMRRGLRTFDLRDSAMRSYNARVKQKLDKTVWATVPASWYKTKSGRITNNWYGPTWVYWLKTRRVDLSAYQVK
jgi:hypothetical protein